MATTSVFHDISTGGHFAPSELGLDGVMVSDASLMEVPFISKPGEAYPYGVWKDQILALPPLRSENDLMIGGKSVNLATAAFFGAKHPFSQLYIDRKVSVINVLPQGQGVIAIPYRRGGKMTPDTGMFKKVVAAAPTSHDHVIVHISTNFHLTSAQAKTIDPSAHVVQIVPSRDQALFLTAESNLADVQLEIGTLLSEAAADFGRVSVTIAAPVAVAMIVGNVLSSGAYAGRTRIYDFVAGQYVLAYEL